MSIVNKIKASVESVTGLILHYYNNNEINTILDNEILPCAFFSLLKDTELIAVGGQQRERAKVAIFFCGKTEFDFDSVENEEIIDAMKRKANTWVHSLQRDGAIAVTSEVRFARFYEVFDCILTGVAVEVTLEELYGWNSCTDEEYEPTNVLNIDENGVFNVKDYYWVSVNVETNWGEIGGDINEQTDLMNELNGKQDTLVSGANIKTINEQSLLGSGNIEVSGGNSAYPRIDMEVTTATIEPNTYYVWGSVSTLSVTKGEELEGLTNEYYLRFTASEGTSVEFLGFSLTWNGGNVPSWASGKTYEISIIDNIALWCEVTIE